MDFKLVPVEDSDFSPERAVSDYILIFLLY